MAERVKAPTFVVVMGYQEPDGGFNVGEAVFGTKEEMEEMFKRETEEGEDYPDIFFCEVVKSSFHEHTYGESDDNVHG